MALVLGVMAASMRFVSMLQVFGSQSTKTAVAPAIQMASAVAKKVLEVVMTSSPGPMPRAMNASQSASVPEFTPTASLALQYAASSFSNCLSFGPITKLPLSKTS